MHLDDYFLVRDYQAEEFGFVAVSYTHLSDPGNLAQGIINASKNIIHTSKTATNMVSNFQETVKIYQQGKKYYDALKSVNNLVKDARKVQQTILTVSDTHLDVYKRQVLRGERGSNVPDLPDFIKERYKPELQKDDMSFLSRSFDRHFNERPYLKHT